MVFDHSTTNILLNMGLVLPLLISLVLFVLSTDEFTAEEWKKKIKVIAEVATTNLKKNRERMEAVREERRDSCGWREV